MPSLSCPSCGCCTRHQALYEKNGSRVSRCTKCGLGRAEARDFDPHGYYTAAYFNGSRSDGYADYASSEAVLRSEFARVVAVLKQHCGTNGRLLEIGSAYGFFLKEAKEAFEVHGIELSADAVKACHDAGLQKVHQGVADAATLARIGAVDAVVMLDVLEHLPDPVETLLHCTRILKPGGVILITTGDFGSITARACGKRWRLMTPPQHLWFFSRTSLANISKSVGLEVVSACRPWKRVPLSLILFQLARMLGLSSRWSMWGPLNRLGIPVNLFDAMRLVLRKPLAVE